MKRILLFVLAVAALSISAAASAAPRLVPAGHATVSGTVLFVPNNMLCVRGKVCNAYRGGPVIFCHAFPGMMATAVPCAKPTASVVTDARGHYSATLSAGMYTIYVHGGKRPWVLRGATLKPGANIINIALNRMTD